MDTQDMRRSPGMFQVDAYVRPANTINTNCGRVHTEKCVLFTSKYYSFQVFAKFIYPQIDDKVVISISLA